MCLDAPALPGRGPRGGVSYARAREAHPPRERRRHLGHVSRRGQHLGSVCGAGANSNSAAVGTLRLDFELLAALSEQVADVGSDDVLEALADGAPAFNTDPRELIDSLLILGERDGERDSRDRRGAKSAGNTGAAMAKARRKANQRVLDLIDIVSVCRAERVKLLAELVTASRNRGVTHDAVAFRRLPGRPP